MNAKSSLIAIAAAAALGLAANAAMADESSEAGFGGHAATSKNQVPGPGVSNPSDPAAGNPHSAAQIPTAPEVQEDLNDSGASGAASGETGAALPKPQSSNPAQQ